MAGTLTIAGWPEIGSATDRSGPTVASWMTHRSAGVSLPAPVDRESIESAIGSIMARLQSQDLRYFGPGCPMLDDPLAPPLRQAALEAGLEVLVEPATPFWLGSIDAPSGFSVRKPADIPRADLSLPVVISGLMSAPAVIGAATAVLDRSDRARLTLISRSGETLQIDSTELSALDLKPHAFPHALIVAPISPLHDQSAIQSLLWVVERLRAADGCPWDRRQTHRSLQRYLPEEAYEASAAIEDDHPGHLAEELGDVLLQIALHSQIATEAGEFAFADVVAGITGKMVHRHPHVFGDINVDGVDDVLRNWEDIKEAEHDTGDSLTAGISAALPALTYARQLVRRAARSGIDLPPAYVDGRITIASGSLEESLDEASGDGALLGELLFRLVELADRRGLDPEFALRQALSRRLNERNHA